MFISHKWLCVVLLAYSVAMMGCSKALSDYQSEADRDVYQTIEDNWRDDYGDKVNYKISDSDPLPEDLQIDKTLPASSVLTLSQAMAMATAHNRQYQTQREDLYLKSLDLRLARHVFEPQFIGGVDGQYANIGKDEQSGAGPFLGLNQLLNTGARITTRVTTAWVEVLTGNEVSGLRNLVSAVITQPLLRGSNSELVMENLTQAQRDTVYQIRTFNRFRKTMAVDVARRYYRVLQKETRMGYAEVNEETLSTVYQRVEKLSKSGRLDLYQLDQARQDHLDAKNDFLEAQKDYAQSLDEFKVFLSLPTTQDISLNKNELTSFDLVSHWKNFKDKNITEDEINESALTFRLDLANQKDSLEDADRKILVAADNLRTGLDIVAETNVRSGGGNLLPRMGLYENSLNVGVELDLPLDRLAESNEYRKALINKTQTERAYEEKMDVVLLEVRKAYRQFIEAAHRYEIQTESLQLSEKRFENTFLLLQYQRASIRDVLDAQEDLFDAQNASINALVDYIVAILELYRDVGVLQVQPDGMWKQATHLP